MNRCRTCNHKLTAEANIVGGVVTALVGWVCVGLVVGSFLWMGPWAIAVWVGVAFTFGCFVAGAA